MRMTNVAFQLADGAGFFLALGAKPQIVFFYMFGTFFVSVIRGQFKLKDSDFKNRYSSLTNIGMYLG